MPEIKWIKITTDIFDNNKIAIIESMPDGDTIIVIWFKILALAGKINDGGSVYFTKEIPFTDQMLATVFNRPLSTIQLALKTFEKFEMIEILDDFIQVSNWEKYQNVEGMEKIREQTRLRVARHRESKKLNCNVTSNATLTLSNATDIDIDIDKDKENKKNKSEIYFCPERSEITSEPQAEIFIEMTLNDGKPHNVLQKDVDEWKKLYPAVDVEQELRNMKGWLNANPTKRKTKSGINRFINNWLSKEQNNPKKLYKKDGFDPNKFISKGGE